MVSQHALQVVSQHALQQGGLYPNMPCRFPGPHPGGKLRGLVGEGCLQAHTWGGVSRPTPRGCIPACTEADPSLVATAAGGMHPTGMHSCFDLLLFCIREQNINANGFVNPLWTE